jgi:hypothetical protein
MLTKPDFIMVGEGFNAFVIPLYKLSVNIIQFIGFVGRLTLGL